MSETIIENKDFIENESKILEISADEYRDKIFEVFPWVMEKPEIEMTAVWIENKEKWHRVRIRLEWDEVVIEEKIKLEGNNSKIKSNKEIPHKNKSDTFDGEIESWKLEWYEEISRSIKTRISFVLDNWVKIEFDKYSDLGWIEIPEFAEIEWPNYETIIDTAEKIGISEDKLLNWSTQELIEFYKK